MCRKNAKKKLVSPHIAMFVNASETPFVSFQNLCFYVLKTFIPIGLYKYQTNQLQ